MNCHQVLSGACNSGDQCFAVGSVEGIPFTAYAAGCNIVILASNFERVQIIPGAIHGYIRIGSLDCSTDTGKIAAAYGAEVCIFEPTPLIHSAATTHGLEYRWVQTGKLTADGPITALSWNLEGTRLLTGGKILQLWHQASLYQEDSQPSSGVTFQIGGSDKDEKPKQQDEEEPGWLCVWQCHTATPAHHLAFSPDGVLFATSGENDRLVKIWYQNKVLIQAHGEHSTQDLNYTFVYVAHPRAVTHLSWRKTSKYMPKGSVGNVLVTSCVDNICRVWAETLIPDDEWGGCVTAHSRSPPRRQRATHRHKHRFMQRLKHMKTCFHIRRNAQSSKQPGAPIPTLPSTYSAHDFHNPYHASSYTGGLHFHLAASINAETDIPLVPSLAGGGRFILHWLHNKEMHFTSQAEAILHDLTKKVLDKEETEEGGSDHTTHLDGENDTRHRRPSQHLTKVQSEDNSNSDEQPGSGNHSHPTLSNTTSINSIATDVTCTHLPDSLDAKIEGLLRDWHQSPDLLFSIHPVDGSFLIWVCEWLDELQAGAIRQAQVSFSARIPSAFPLGDATTMCTPAALYHAAAQPLYVRHRTKPVIPGQQQQPPPETVTTPLASVQEEKEENEWPHGQPEEQKEAQENGNLEENNNDMKRKASVVTEDTGENQEGDVLDSAPVISMVTNHTNGTLNLWQLTFDDRSKFSQVLSIGHASRASGHRFRVNDITCHPVLPLLLTTSHHNISDSERDLHTMEEDAAAGGLCSELIMWRVECVGPLGKSGGVSELARVNSPHLSAFSNVAWLPTLLPSTTLGNLSNSPSACFVASDGESLRVFQAVIDARTLLAEIATSERRHNNNNVMQHDTLSMSSESTLEEGSGIPLHDRIKIVSQQSTARPGAIIQLHAIADATHDWHNTQLLHVFQEQLITGERTTTDTESGDSGVEGDTNTITESGLAAIVDLRKAAVFNEPFYIVVLERTDGGSTVHMWRLTVSSQADSADDLTNSMLYVPDSALIQEDEGESRKNSVSFDTERPPPAPPNSHLAITTKKVCECPLALPDGVDVIHAAPAAGHLSSASIYPACLAPYILATACTDSTLRFWKCSVTKNEKDEYDYSWKEWEMMNKEQESMIDIPGQPLHISAAYSGRIACAYKCGRSFTRPKGGGTTSTNSNPDARFVNLCVCVYECESTGGAEWLLEDTIPLKNVSLPRVGVCADTQIDLSYLHNTAFMQKKQRLTQVLQTLSADESRINRNGEGDSGKSAGLLAVPSFSTLQSLRKSIMENGNTCPLTQKHLVQLDWVSKEDGSHILTVAVGSRVLLFTPVSSDLAQANLKAMKESINNNRPILRKASSLAAPLFVEEIRWMQLRRIQLKTADGLPPLPMQISWVRDGILVVGMDSEMHVYSQWKPENQTTALGMPGAQEVEEGGESRALRDSDLRVSAPHLQRVSSINLQLLERDARRRNKTQPDQPQPLLDYMPDYGLFEASQMACPVLPQYHPKQLMELLNSGKIRWVKAILAHLVRCIGGTCAGRGSQGDEDSLSRQRGWSRSRTLSVSFAAGAASPLDGVGQITEDVQLDYAEITSVPPLPLWTLLVADKESAHHPSTIQEAKDYNVLFDGTMDVEEDLDALLLGDDECVDRRPSMPERQPLSHFGPRQGRILSRLLTHTHLPGLSSLDQMHLLALADTVSTCDADLAERIANNARVDVPQGAGQEVLPDSLDDCGLRFLLAMKHYGYLLRCLPLAQRGTLQRTGVGTCNLVWAFHSETHEQLLALIPGYTKGQPKWNTMRELGVGWWIRGDLLRVCVERLARASYMAKQDPMDAALYYLAMKKRMLLWGLFRSNRDEKMTAFFANDFTEDRWRKAALKNAFVLLGRQRFEHAAAFFLLGGALKDALEVLITRLGDLQLAMIVARLYESDNPASPSLKKLLMDEILGGETEDGELDLEKAHPDPFVRSMALWELKRYTEALDTLLTPAGRLHAARDNEPMPSVFNFYVYLRTHPRLKRHNLPSQGATLALLQQEADEGITRLERRLYFQTAHGHFKAGCPALALEVLSKLPARIRDEKRPAPVSAPSVDEATIHTGQFTEESAAKIPEVAAAMDWGASADMDWGAPVSAAKTDELVLTWEDNEEDKGSEASGASTPPLEMKIGAKDDPEGDGALEASEKEKEEEPPTVDIMAQQLKFTACLKILMEELSTLATGFEVDGGHLRYQLYIWLEREVEALRRLCGYASATGAAGGGELICADADPPPLPERPTLHQLLIREKADFEAKVQRAVRRKKWLKANETLLRTLLSYCSLQGAGGGGLASVRMELVLLLQELGQDKQHQQLLSPLPFPTTLPLLAAAVATNNTVVADPVRHLQSVAHDMLGTLSEMGIPGGAATRLLHTLRELAVALSASEAFCAVYLALLGWALAARDAHLLYRLAAHTADAKAHSKLYGGGPKLVERTEGTSVWSSLREKRALLNMRLLGLGPSVPHKNIQEGRPTYREQFVPPYCSILTFLLTKPTYEQDAENYDYDSAESGAEDPEDSASEADDDDVFDTTVTSHVSIALAFGSCPQLATTSPTVHGALRRVDQWQQQLTENLEARPPPPDYIPGCFPEQLPAGPPINKYRCLLEKHNTPFNSNLYSAAPARRLWSFLVRQELVQEIFIRAVFSRRRAQSVADGGGEPRAGQPPRGDDLHSPVRIIHKEQDSIAAPNNGSIPGTGNSSPQNPNAPQMPVGMASQTGRGASVVTRVRFSDYGNKFAAADADGNLAMWQLQPSAQQHDTTQPHAPARPFFLYRKCRYFDLASAMDSEDDTKDDVDSGNESSGDDVDFAMDVETHSTRERQTELEEYPYEVLSTEEIVQHMVDCIKDVNTVVEMMTGLECGHRFCTQCWSEYLTTKIMEEGLCNRLLRWCPSPDCSNAIKVAYVDAAPVTCRCQHTFCFSCGENWHDPVRCSLLRKWIKKCDDDSETSNWIAANTKECPKCNVTIEKDGGCNHMVCKNQNCKADFCWVCLGPWEPHGSSWYNCNRYDEDEAKAARDAQERSRAALQRYLFYCNRYMNHMQSLRFESKLYASVKEKMEEMQQHNMSWIEAKQRLNTRHGNSFRKIRTRPKCQSVWRASGRGASVVLKHKIDNIKRMAAHPSQPLCNCVWSPRAPGAFAKVTRVRFSDYGNKFAAADADGNLAMWQLHPSAQQHDTTQPHAPARPFFTHQCHSKGISDFVFLGSCSLVATAGHSSESKNVAIWDTLMPIKKALVVFSLMTHQLLHTFAGEHARSSFFKHIGFSRNTVEALLPFDTLTNLQNGLATESKAFGFTVDTTTVFAFKPLVFLISEPSHHKASNSHQDHRNGKQDEDHVDPSDDEEHRNTSGGWQEVRYRKNRFSSVRGTAGPEATPLRAVEYRKYIHLWNMVSDADEIRAYLRSLSPESLCTVEELRPKGEYKSYKIGVPAVQYERCLSADVWPANARIRPWLFRKPHPKGLNSSLGLGQKSSVDLTLIYQNVRGLNTRLSFFKHNLLCLDCDVIAVTESFLTDSIENPELVGNEWSVERRDRTSGARGGGVLLAARPGLVDGLGGRYKDDVDSGNESSGDDVDFAMDVETHSTRERQTELEEYPYEVLSTEEIVQHMVDCIKDVNTVVEKLMERFYDGDQDQLFSEARVINPFRKPMMTGLECGHRFCTQCWSEYLTTKIMEEGLGQTIACAAHACDILVDDATVMRLVRDPRVKLNNAIKVAYVDAAPVTCRCQHTFCFSCGENWHDPVRCSLLRKWIKKCDDDSETSNWIAANTKECPKCNVTIEKDGGCNHMVCKNQNCKADFCWVCLGPWEPHGSSWYNCNRYDEDEAKAARDAQERSRAALQRYLFYCNRYMNHMQSLRFESKLYASVKEKMEEMQQHNMSWIEEKFYIIIINKKPK
ncbi:hypothetical protein MSG28_012272 [Choristoneura fumiferana]|uniref:Uncharacterized protein n=1 Tax=Choristoneura fumiferana TaxID=7141 RepID=A0ACC0KDI5_CHOFU|nr:hypothetical protein MSG28_012272 [Choristoneura fumiferana]